ncbi:MAG: hypothetical protein OXT70_12660, partial [Chloroflexota bacterium]|nr:hypothetical protein [Chloroflexota bacterium]
MKRLFPRPNPAAASPEEDAASATEAPIEATADNAETSVQPERPAKPLPELPLCFSLSHVEPDGPVRLDGVKLALTELMGLELDAPKLGAFAGLLNACDFPLQLLVRQHPPDLDRMRRELEEAQPGDLPDQTREAARSQRRLLSELESREGILDRRFYAVCEEEHTQELRGLLARSGLSIHPLKDEALQRLVIASALGGSPARSGRDESVEVQLNQRHIRLGQRLGRSLHLSKWPRSLAPGFLQQLMATGAPMDIALHLGPIPSEQAARQLEWQKVRFESARSLS